MSMRHLTTDPHAGRFIPSHGVESLAAGDHLRRGDHRTGHPGRNTNARSCVDASASGTWRDRHGGDATSRGVDSCPIRHERSRILRTNGAFWDRAKPRPRPLVVDRDRSSQRARKATRRGAVRVLTRQVALSDAPLCVVSVVSPLRTVRAAMDTMLYWLARAAREAREKAGRKQVHVAAYGEGMNPRTIARFEAGRAWPRDPDLVIEAYADDLDVAPLELWARAVELWRRDGGR